MEFLGRDSEIQNLSSHDFSQKSKLTVVYGRRRVGKSTLVRKAFHDRSLLCFEGLEGESTPVQKKEFLSQLFKQLGSAKRIQPPSPNSSWSDIFIYLSQILAKKPTVVFMDEFQWIAADRKALVSHLKYVWDNYFLEKNRIHLVLCGSVSSFLVKKVLRSKALYGRIDLTIHLKPLKFQEVRQGFFKKRTLIESLEAYLCVGGIPRYLELFDERQSLFLNLQKLAFQPEGYLCNDFEKIFVSHFGKNPIYQKIIMNLARKKFMTREELIREEYDTSGGRMTEYLEELTLADFIEKYQPLHKSDATKLNRYRIFDNFLQFYFRFLFPNRKKIADGFFIKKPFPLSQFQPYCIWLGLAFEQFCCQHHDILAQKLGFSAVDYQYGSYFGRDDQKTGYQVDLLFSRADQVLTLCEIKFRNRPIGKEVIPEVLKKIEGISLKKKKTIEPVLITVSPPSQELLAEGFFIKILLFEDIFSCV